MERWSVRFSYAPLIFFKVIKDACDSKLYLAHFRLALHCVNVLAMKWSVHPSQYAQWWGWATKGKGSVAGSCLGTCCMGWPYAWEEDLDTQQKLIQGVRRESQWIKNLCLAAEAVSSGCYQHNFNVVPIYLKNTGLAKSLVAPNSPQKSQEEEGR